MSDLDAKQVKELLYPDGKNPAEVRHCGCSSPHCTGQKEKDDGRK